MFYSLIDKEIIRKIIINSVFLSSYHYTIMTITYIVTKAKQAFLVLFCLFRTRLVWSSLNGWKLWVRVRLAVWCWWSTEKRASITPWRSSTSRRSIWVTLRWGGGVFLGGVCPSWLTRIFYSHTDFVHFGCHYQDSQEYVILNTEFFFKHLDMQLINLHVRCYISEAQHLQHWSTPTICPDPVCNNAELL